MFYTNNTVPVVSEFGTFPFKSVKKNALIIFVFFNQESNEKMYFF